MDAMDGSISTEDEDSDQRRRRRFQEGKRLCCNLAMGIACVQRDNRATSRCIKKPRYLHSVRHLIVLWLAALLGSCHDRHIHSQQKARHILISITL